jgi:hypothetical protein
MHKKIMPFVTAIFLMLGLISSEAEAADRNLAEDVQKAFDAEPLRRALWSHFPVPLVFAPWEAVVTARYTRTGLMQFNETAYVDLPPCVGEQLQRALQADPENPHNAFLENLLKEDKTYASNVILAMLRADPRKRQWSAIDAIGGYRSEEIQKALIQIAGKDPDATDRAFALRQLADYDTKDAEDALLAGAFDERPSIRAFCMQLLARKGNFVVDPNALIRSRMTYAFPMYFREAALLRLLPQLTAKDIFQHEEADQFGFALVSNGPFLQKTTPEQIDATRAVAPQKLTTFTKLAAAHLPKLGAAEALYVLGDEASAKAAITVMKDVLVKQDTSPKKEEYNAFAVRTGIIEALQSGGITQQKLLAAELQAVLPAYDKSQDMWLIALCYGLEGTTDEQTLQALAQIKDLQVQQPDLYVGAAGTLAKANSPLAFPSLLHILSLKIEPFATVAGRTLTELTGIAGPGDARTDGVLEKIGVPTQWQNADTNYKFWQGWYEKNRHRLRFDGSRKKFVTSP